jgi:2-polyprenyl-3-methyl-5-hydroxy-6-metoxy-1,4-benzoquinol methylase
MKNTLLNNFDILICPICGETVSIRYGKIVCKNGHEFPIKDNIPLMFVDDNSHNNSSVTQNIKAFYEEHPFPNYDKFDSLRTLLIRADNSIFAKKLDDELPYNIKVLEIGCGTGQLTNYLGISNRLTYGTDISFNSLKLAEIFKESQSLKRSSFYQMNLFKPIFKEKSFNVIISNGVLHHTANPEKAFETISKLLKLNGYIIIGLYNKYGRLFTDIRRILFRFTGNIFYSLDPYMKRKDIESEKKSIWFLDQYKNPYETKHTYRQILKWFKKYGFDYISSLPEIGTIYPPELDYKLFTKKSTGNFLSRALTQLALPLKKNNEGGFFIMIGKKIINELFIIILTPLLLEFQHIIDNFMVINEL